MSFVPSLSQRGYNVATHEINRLNPPALCVDFVVLSTIERATVVDNSNESIPQRDLMVCRYSSISTRMG